MSLLDEIRRRANQPTVPPRQDVLQQQPTTTDTLTQKDVAPAPEVQQPTEVSELKRLEELLANFPEIATRVPVRLETPIKDELDELCNREKVTIETLLEAFYVTCKDKESVMRQVLKEAKKRLKSRKEVGNIRSSLTKLNNLTKNKK
jgi:predicted DNA-binding ribbon-helix-helix protein